MRKLFVGLTLMASMCTYAMDNSQFGEGNEDIHDYAMEKDGVVLGTINVYMPLFNYFVTLPHYYKMAEHDRNIRVRLDSFNTHSLDFKLLRAEAGPLLEDIANLESELLRINNNAIIEQSNEKFQTVVAGYSNDVENMMQTIQMQAMSHELGKQYCKQGPNPESCHSGKGFKQEISSEEIKEAINSFYKNTKDQEVIVLHSELLKKKNKLTQLQKNMQKVQASR